MLDPGGKWTRSRLVQSTAGWEGEPYWKVIRDIFFPLVSFMSETGQGRSPPSPSLPVLLFTSPTWQISAPPQRLLAVLLPTYTYFHTIIHCCCAERAQGRVLFRLCQLVLICAVPGPRGMEHTEKKNKPNKHRYSNRTRTSHRTGDFNTFKLFYPLFCWPHDRNSAKTSGHTDTNTYVETPAWHFVLIIHTETQNTHIYLCNAWSLLAADNLPT